MGKLLDAVVAKFATEEDLAEDAAIRKAEWQATRSEEAGKWAAQAEELRKPDAEFYHDTRGQAIRYAQNQVAKYTE